MEFNKNWLNPLLVIRCFIEAHKEYRRHQKEEKEYRLKMKQGSKKDKKEK